MSLEHFYLNRFRFSLEMLEQARLPVYKGTTLRGGFGFTFRKLVCYQPHVPRCNACLLRFSCPYPQLFETFVPPDAEVLRNLTRAPIPLIIEPPLERRQTYAAGDPLTFHVTLIGDAVRYLSYVAVAFQELGHKGLGKDHGRYRLTRIEAVQPFTGESALVHDSSAPAIIRASHLPVRYTDCVEEAERLTDEAVGMQFLTPTRLKNDGQYMRGEVLPFDVVWRTLMRRVSSLAYFHCGSRWEADYQRLAAAAREVETRASAMRWVTFRRYSTRQEQLVPLSGLVGKAWYRGELRPFLPVLVLGELVHVGKATVFGNGRYRLGSPDDVWDASGAARDRQSPTARSAE